MKKLLTTLGPGGSGGGEEEWQVNTHGGAMAQLAVNLNAASMIINDAVYSR